MSFVVQSSIVVKQALLDALLAALSARPAAALLDTPTAHLFVNDINPDAGTVVGDFTEAAFSGYAADALGALIGPVTFADGTRGMHVETDFAADGSIVGPGEVAYGVYVTDTGGTVLYWSGRFNDPQPFANPGDFLSLDLVFPESAFRSAD